MLTPKLSVLIQAALLLVLSAPIQAAKPLVVEMESPLGFEETLTQLKANAKAVGWKVPKSWTVNFQKNLMKVTKTDVGPNTVLKMCEPFAAAKILARDEYKKLSATMPCSISVYVKSDGKTYISMMNLEVMADMYGGIVAELLNELSPQMEKMLKLD